MCHVTNLIIQSTFDNIKEIIYKIRYACHFIGCLQSGIKLYKETCSRFNVKPKKCNKILNMDGIDMFYVACCYFL